MIELRREYDLKQTGKIDFVDFSEICKWKFENKLNKKINDGK